MEVGRCQEGPWLGPLHMSGVKVAAGVSLRRNLEAARCLRANIPGPEEEVPSLAG